MRVNIVMDLTGYLVVLKLWLNIIKNYLNDYIFFVLSKKFGSFYSGFL